MRRLLFYGELPPNSIHGIAISNQINLKMLNSSFSIDIVEEKSRLTEHNKISINKLANFMKNNLIILAKSIGNRYDYFYLVLSLSTAGSLKTLTALTIFRLFNRGRVVIHLHRGDFFSCYYQKKINRILTKLIFCLSQNIIVLSENQKSEFESVFRRQFLVLCNTIETEYEIVAERKDNNRFIFISNYLEEKGVIDLLEVFRKLTNQFPQISLRTFGAFSDIEFKNTMLKYASDKISINGPIGCNEKFKELLDSDCLILPSWNEGQPMILLEAMSVGTPIISTNVGMIQELLGDDYPYFSKPRDQASLENNILKYMNHTNTQQISGFLRTRYLSLYSHEMHENRLLSIFG